MSGARHRIACLVAILALAAPQAAFAQGAGDEQYQDPFGGENGQSDEGEDQAQATPTPVPDTSSSSGDGAQTTVQATPTPAPVPATAAQEQLPRTGADAGLLALGGTVLLAGGLVLRRRVSADADSA
jgi:LPXTG-motif cell wall-anchored protein